MSDSPLLTLEVETKAGTRQFPVTAVPCVIGSDEDSGVRFRHPSVLGAHALISRSGGRLFVSKLDPAAAMQVGGRESDRAPLLDGAVVRIGAVPMRVRLSAPLVEAASGPPPAGRQPLPAGPVARVASVTVSAEASGRPGPSIGTKQVPGTALAGTAVRGTGSGTGAATVRPGGTGGSSVMPRTLIFGWLLIALGAADILQWALTKPRYGWTNHLMGDNCFTRNGWGVMILVGWMLVKRGNAERRATKGQADLEAGESVVLTKRSLSGVLTVTDRRIRFFEADLSAYRKAVKCVPAEAATDVSFADISSIQPVRQNQVASTKLAALITKMWGISITMKDGTVINLPVPDAEEVALVAQRMTS